MSEIGYDTIPSGLYSPGQFIEFSDVLANTGLQGQPHRMLLIGETSTAANQDRVITLSSAAQAVALFGAGSTLARMATAVFAVQNTIPVDVVALAPAAGAVKAAGAVTLAGAATASGELPLYINGVNVSVPVASGASAATVATALLAEIASIPNLPVTAAAGAAGVITLTARPFGLTGNDLDVRSLYYSDDAPPAGLTVAITPMSGGAGNPDITAAIAAIGDTWYTSFVNPYTDAANVAALATELASRWGPTRQIDGRAYMALRGSQGAMATFGNAQNNQNMVTFSAIGPSSPPELAAQAAAQIEASTSVDPARPVWTLPLPTIVAPSQAEQLNYAARNMLLLDRISPVKVVGGVTQLDRVVVMYQTDPSGASTMAYFDVTTVTNLSYLRWSERNMVATKYARSKLADNGTPVAAGQPIVTPLTMAGELVALATQWLAAGLIENVAAYQAALLTQRDTTNRSRLNALSSPDLVGGLAIFCDQIQFQE